MTRTLSPMVLRAIVLIGLVVVISAIFQALTPVYLTWSNFLGMLRAMSINGIVAIGLTFVIVVRKFDLSLAGVASLAAMTLGFTLANTDSLAWTITASIAIGLLCGMINGMLVGFGRLPDVVTTIAVGSVAYGMAFVYNDGATYSQNFFSSGMVTMNFETVLGLQVPVFLLLITAIVCGYLMHATRIGQSLYATGENPLAASYSGVLTRQITVLAFGACGALVGLAMVLHVSGIGSSRVTAGGQILLPAYTSVYLGAALLGRASIHATLVGVLITTMLLNGFTLLAVPYYYRDAVVCLVLILAITVFDPKVLKLLTNTRKLTGSRAAA